MGGDRKDDPRAASPPLPKASWWKAPAPAAGAPPQGSEPAKATKARPEPSAFATGFVGIDRENPPNSPENQAKYAAWQKAHDAWTNDRRGPEPPVPDLGLRAWEVPTTESDPGAPPAPTEARADHVYVPDLSPAALAAHKTFDMRSVRIAPNLDPRRAVTIASGLREPDPVLAPAPQPEAISPDALPSSFAPESEPPLKDAPPDSDGPIAIPGVGGRSRARTTALAAIVGLVATGVVIVLMARGPSPTSGVATGEATAKPVATGDSAPTASEGPPPAPPASAAASAEAIATAAEGPPPAPVTSTSAASEVSVPSRPVPKAPPRPPQPAPSAPTAVTTMATPVAPPPSATPPAPKPSSTKPAVPERPF